MELQRTSKLLDSTLTEKEACKDKCFSIRLEINALKGRKDNITSNRDALAKKLIDAEQEYEELTLALQGLELKISKLEKLKKQAAIDKKFKDASKAQADIKEAQAEFDEANAKLAAVTEVRNTAKVEVRAKDIEIQ